MESSVDITSLDLEMELICDIEDEVSNMKLTWMMYSVRGFLIHAFGLGKDDMASS